MNHQRPEYRTWIRTKAIVLFAFLTLVPLAGTGFAVWSEWFLLLLIPALAFGYILAIISLSSYRFSAKGGDYQNKIHQLIVDSVERNSSGRILDIGCGSGHLVVKIAKAHPGATLTGIDYWGQNWEYSKTQAEKNSELEGVGGRATFLNGTASKLSFDDNHFDIVVSCLTFHEVRDVKDKLVCAREAIRVLKPSGQFVFFDLFLDRNFYPPIDEIKSYMAQCGAKTIEVKKIGELIDLPFPLNNKKVLGYGVLITGTKTA